MVLSACTRLRPLAKLRKLCAIACPTPHSAAPSPHQTPQRLRGGTASGVVAWPSQKSVSPATEVIMGMEAEGLKLLPSRSLMRPAHPVGVAEDCAAFCHCNC